MVVAGFSTVCIINLTEGLPHVEKRCSAVFCSLEVEEYVLDNLMTLFYRPVMILNIDLMFGLQCSLVNNRI